MELSKCKNCGASDFVRKGDKYVCQYCGTEYPIPADELAKEKKANTKKTAQKTSPRPQNIPISHSTEKTGYVDASPKRPLKKKLSRNSQIAIAFIIVVVVFYCISALSNSDSSDENNNATAMVETETVKATEQTEASEKERETESETQMGETEAIDVFDYDISGDEVKLKSYHGESDFLEISPTYTVDGIEYNTNLTTFEVGSHNMDTIIFDEGITELYLLAFRDTCSEQVYLPTTLTYIYDKTLSYLHDNRDGGVVQIYYGGTEDQWNSIYTVYERSDVSNEEAAAELGASLANKINAIVEDGSGTSEYEYHFYVLPDDLK